MCIWGSPKQFGQGSGPVWCLALRRHAQCRLVSVHTMKKARQTQNTCSSSEPIRWHG